MCVPAATCLTQCGRRRGPWLCVRLGTPFLVLAVVVVRVIGVVTHARLSVQMLRLVLFPRAPEGAASDRQRVVLTVASLGAEDARRHQLTSAALRAALPVRACGSDTVRRASVSVCSQRRRADEAGSQGRRARRV
jgi:hypothetical protein